MAVEVVSEDKPIEWTPEMEALAKEPAMPPGLETIPEPPVPEVKPDEEPEQHVESASDVDAGSESESAADQLESTEPEGLEPDEIELAKAYGFTDDEIGEFSDSASLARAIAPFERRLMREEEPSATETKAPVVETPKAPEKKPEAKVETPEDFDIDENEYDPVVVKLAKAHKASREELAALKTQLAQFDELKSYVESARQREQQALNHERVQHFDSIVDAFDEADKFGKSEDPSKWTQAQYEARAKLWQETGRMIERLQEGGKQASLTKAIVSRAAIYAFPEDIRKQETAKVQKAIVSQSKKRLGRPTAPKKIAIPAGDPEKNPEVMSGLQQLWNEMQAENGTLVTR